MNIDPMNTGLVPLKMCSAVVTLDQYLEGWNLADVEPYPTPEARSYSYYVSFDNPFSYVPLVHVGISGFDIDNRDSSRLSVRAEEISTDGFKIIIQTWMHTQVYKVEVSWLALGNS